MSVNQQVYGPFDDATLWSYVQEGRVTASSSLSSNPGGPFQPASAQTRIAHWFQDEARSPQPTRVEQTERLLFLMAEVRSGQSLAFLQTLQTLGRVERLGDSVWLLQTRLTLDQCRQALGPTLAASDNLFALDSQSGDYVSVNLGSAAEARIRAMFEAVRP